MLDSKSFIEQAYINLITQFDDFTFREEQKNLSENIFHAFFDKQPFLAEAPTGTGKTIAYLIGALAAKEVINLPIIVSTATVNLQDQILTNDVPKLVKAGILPKHAVLVAKGRGRYFCPKTAERFLTEYGTDILLQNDLFDDKTDKLDLSSKVRDANLLQSLWKTEEWLGDIDDLPTMRPVHWDLFKASVDTCVGHKCEYYDYCPFFMARKKLAFAEIIIANHDLVLSDLLMALDDKETVFPFKHYNVIFDEAHHLPQKAINHGESKFEPIVWEQHKPILGMLISKIFKSPSAIKALENKNIHLDNFEEALADIGVLAHDLHSQLTAAMQLQKNNKLNYYLFKRGRLPDNILNLLQKLYKQLNLLSEFFQIVLAVVKSNKTKTAEDTSLLFFLLAPFNYLKDTSAALKAILCTEDRVRWVEQWTNEELQFNRIFLCVSPLEGSDILIKPLWESDRANPVLLSATLKDLDSGFKRFATAVGLTKPYFSSVYPHVFPYRENKLVIPFMDFNPKQEGYVAELAGKLLEHIDIKEGTLILFNSKFMLKEVYSALSRSYTKDMLLMQGNRTSTKKLIEDHKARINKGEGSILMGVQSLAEGLDLPGKYCTHVIIARLPFSQPDNPVEVEKQERIGDTYFEEYMLPDALLKLTQMVGRLMRKESDRGKITIFDSRIVNRKWGRRMLESLPPFTQTRSRL